MIQDETQYRAVQREMQRLKEFLRAVEDAPEHPNKELSIVGIYKKMSSLWDELEDYYRACIGDARSATGDRAPAGISPAS